MLKFRDAFENSLGAAEAIRRALMDGGFKTGESLTGLMAVTVAAAEAGGVSKQFVLDSISRIWGVRPTSRLGPKRRSCDDLRRHR